MRSRHRALCRVVALVVAAAGLGLGLSGSASASPSMPAIPAIPGIPDCKDAPTPQMPGAGLPGFVDPAPKPIPAQGDPFKVPATTSIYDQYGYAGLRWSTYDLGCGGAARDMDATIDTAVGNAFLSAGVWVIATANGLHNKISQPSQYMAPLDDVVTAVTQRLNKAIWSPWGAVALVGVAVLLLLYSARGNLSSATSAAAWALLVLAILGGVVQYPSRVATFFDGSVTSTIDSVNAGSASLTGLDNTSQPGRAQGALLVDSVLYDAWLRGMFGASDTPAAKRWGPQLFKASAFTWSEAQRAQADKDVAKRLTEQKQEEWKKATAQIEEQAPPGTNIQGKAGSRAGSGFMALLGALFTSAFRLVADVFLFAGLVMLRLLVMLFPAVAVVGVLAPMAGIVRRVGNMAGASVVNVVAFSTGAVIHTTVVSAILSRATSVGMGVLALVLCLVVTAAAFVIMWPLLSFSNLLGQSGSGHRILRRTGRQALNYAIGRQATKDGVADAQEEANPARPASATTASGTKPGRAVRLAGPPAETFSRPAPSGFPPVGDGERFLPAPAKLRLTGVEAPRLDQASPPLATPHATEPRDTNNTDHPQDDPAYALAAAAEPSRAGTPDRRPLVERGEVLRGVLVDEVPENTPELPNLAHDSHTVFRRDGIGPRLYDPDTKQTVLSVQKRPEE